MTVDKKFRVACINDFVGTATGGNNVDESILYRYTETLEEAKDLARRLGDSNMYQSNASDKRTVTIERGGLSVSIPNPNIAVIEMWDDTEQDWFCYND